MTLESYLKISGYEEILIFESSFQRTFIIS